MFPKTFRRDEHLVRSLLLGAGVASSLMYIALDLFSAARFPGYSLTSQAVSELSAIGAPTARYWSVFGPVYQILFIVFGIGVLREDDRNRMLRITGRLLIGFGAFGVLWAFFPMHQRGTAMTWTDVGHIVLGATTVVFILTFIAVGAFALDRRFRVFSFATLLVLAVAGIVTFSWAPRLARGEPTPLLGLIERINVYGYLVWVAVLGLTLSRRQRSASSSQIRPSRLERIVPASREILYGEPRMPGVIDPVCGMTIESETARARTEYEGRTFYFCSESCKRAFDADPARYAGAALADQPEALERHEPPFTKAHGWVSPKFGSAGSGGAEYERLPEAHDSEDPSRDR